MFKFLQWAWETLSWVEGVWFTVWIILLYYAKVAIDNKFKKK